MDIFYIDPVRATLKMEYIAKYTKIDWNVVDIYYIYVIDKYYYMFDWNTIFKNIKVSDIEHLTYIQSVCVIKKIGLDVDNSLYKQITNYLDGLLA